MSAQQDLVNELVRLRRGWGLQSRDLRARIGPQLVRLCGIDDADNGRRIQEKIRRWLNALSADLPPELARALLVALAVDRSHQHRMLTSRVESFASEQNWAPRTARRRIDHATRLVVQAAFGPTSAQDGDPAEGTEPAALAAVLRLDAARRHALGSRVVVMRVPVPVDRFDLLIKFEAV